MQTDLMFMTTKTVDSKNNDNDNGTIAGCQE